MKRQQTHYRDRRTGRFVSRSTWNRSKAQGGTRYKRDQQRVVTGRRSRVRKAAARGPAKLQGGAPAKPKPILKPVNREYFVVVLFRTRKRGKTVDRRLQEVIITAKDGASESEIKQKYAEWLTLNTKWSTQSIYNIVYGENAGRRVEFRVVPRDEPTAEPAGTIKPNDTRNPKKRKGKA